MKLLITGSRDWTDGEVIAKRLAQEPAATTVIEGGASGADRLAYYVALMLGFKVVTVYADWQAQGRAAGPIRNRQMLDMKPDKVLAFCKNNSKGTMDCVAEARKRGIPVELFTE